MVSHWVKFTAIFVVAAALLVAGFVIAWYPSYVSEIKEMNLGQSGLTQAERDSLESSLSWWNNQGVYIYGSVANFVLVGGVLVLIYAIVYSLTSAWRESVSAKVASEEQRYAPQVEPEDYQYDQSKQRVRTGFPIAAGVLTIITSSIIMAFSGIFIVGGIGSILTTMYGYSYQGVNLLGDGITGVLVFGFALTAGVMILKRKNFVFAIIGLCFMLVKGTTFIIVTGEVLGISLGIIIIAIAILSIIFTSISYKEFS